MEDLGELAPLVQILDLPVPQMVDYVADALRILDRPISEQVIEVPKISCSPCPSRSPIPEPQSAEQLVEVPTVLSPTRIALMIAEQIVSTPVPRGRGQGFLPEQSSTAISSSGKCISERTVEQIVDISPGGGLGQGVLYCWHRDTRVSTYDLPPIPGRGSGTASPGRYTNTGRRAVFAVSRSSSP